MFYPCQLVYAHQYSPCSGERRETNREQWKDYSVTSLAGSIRPMGVAGRDQAGLLSTRDSRQTGDSAAGLDQCMRWKWIPSDSVSCPSMSGSRNVLPHPSLSSYLSILSIGYRKGPGANLSWTTDHGLDSAFIDVNQA